MGTYEPKESEEGKVFPFGESVELVDYPVDVKIHNTVSPTLGENLFSSEVGFITGKVLNNTKIKKSELMALIESYLDKTEVTVELKKEYTRDVIGEPKLEGRLTISFLERGEEDDYDPF